LLADSPCIDAGDPNYVAEPNETDIDGQIRVFAGNVDMGADEFVPAIEVAMHFTPKTLNPKSKGRWMKAHMVLPEGFSAEDVDVNTPAVIEPVGIESDYINVFINEDGLVEVEVGFDRHDLCSAGMNYGPAEVTVIGLLANGQPFVGSDKIRILTNDLRYVAEFCSYWLAADCGAPDWCGGSDLDQDSVVDFLDFALFNGCCIKVIRD
jgi:hypothetical protein